MPRKSASKLAVVLFEDDPEHQQIRWEQIQQALDDQSVPVLLFDDTGIQRKEGDVELTLEKALKSPKYQSGSIGLIVCDKELGKYNKIQVTSDSVVSAVAERLGLPICLYERGDKGSAFALDKVKRWKQKEIVVDESREKFGVECTGLYHGFAFISREVEKIVDEPTFKKMTPAEILTRVLKREDEADRIALYGAGEQNMLLELLPYYDQSKRDPTRAIRKRYHRVLGNWLYNSILRFPGILVNEVAAASLLNIHVDDFAKIDVQKLFAKACYKGPFSDCGKWWWRRDLEQKIASEECETGLDYVEKKGLEGVRQCHCAEDPSHRAGYYCMITERPVCHDHSRGGISWFPGGADLARVSLTQFKKIGPFMGLF